MPPWIGDLIRFVSWGSATGWLGLSCPAHCGASWPYLLAIFLAGLSTGGLLAIGLFAWLSWISGQVTSPVAPPLHRSSSPAPLARLQAYLHERSHHHHHLD